MADERTGDGARAAYVTWERLSEVLREHERHESTMRHKKAEEVIKVWANAESRLGREMDELRDAFSNPDRKHEKHHQEIHDWQTTMRTAAVVAKIAFGTSIVSAVVTVLQVVDRMGGRP